MPELVDLVCSILVDSREVTAVRVNDARQLIVTMQDGRQCSLTVTPIN